MGKLIIRFAHFFCLEPMDGFYPPTAFGERVRLRDDSAGTADGDPQPLTFPLRCLDSATLKRMKEVIMFN